MISKRAAPIVEYPLLEICCNHRVLPALVPHSRRCARTTLESACSPAPKNKLERAFVTGLILLSLLPRPIQSHPPNLILVSVQPVIQALRASRTVNPHVPTEPRGACKGDHTSIPHHPLSTNPHPPCAVRNRRRGAPLSPSLASAETQPGKWQARGPHAPRLDRGRGPPCPDVATGALLVVQHMRMSCTRERSKRSRIEAIQDPQQLPENRLAESRRLHDVMVIWATEQAVRAFPLPSSVRPSRALNSAVSPVHITIRLAASTVRATHSQLIFYTIASHVQGGPDSRSRLSRARGSVTDALPSARVLPICAPDAPRAYGETRGAPRRYPANKVLVEWSDMPRVMQAILDFIYNARLDNLHTLKLHNHDANMYVGDKLVAEALVGQDSSRSVIFKTQPPLLYDIQLLNIPELLIQHRSTPLVCNLTSLDLVAMVSLPPLNTLYKLLLHSPRLELLSLCTKLVKKINSLYLAPTAPRVNMPHLRQFTLNEPASVSWGLSVLKMVDAPGLEMFSLGLSHFINLGTILSYIAFGRSSGQLVDNHSRLSEHIVGIDGAAIYPALEHLTITRMPYPPKSIIHVLKAFQNITRLDWEVGMNSDAELCTVLAESAVCSQLEHLRIHQVPAELEILARQRAEQGQPLLIVEELVSSNTPTDPNNPSIAWDSMLSPLLDDE
ncbi:hypothetical protein BDV93DRAFT_608384 [Ceratobasidium sp. AG-I]|nr:hypothetical protein BDV93DRAFT_608384 [Ceratobasidium sp. AG-I]